MLQQVERAEHVLHGYPETAERTVVQQVVLTNAYRVATDLYDLVG